MEKIYDMLVIQLTQMHISFGRSCIVLEHRYKDNILYSRLGGYVSRAALSYIFEEARRSKEACIQKNNCGYVIRASYGLLFVCICFMDIHHEKPI